MLFEEDLWGYLKLQSVLRMISFGPYFTLELKYILRFEDLYKIGADHVQNHLSSINNNYCIVEYILFVDLFPSAPCFDLFGSCLSIVILLREFICQGVQLSHVKSYLLKYWTI